MSPRSISRWRPGSRAGRGGATDPTSFLFITLDSCRYDTFVAADAPNLKAVGETHRALAPAAFTYASHAAMFVGFTPWVPERVEPFLNPKLAKIFKMAGAGFPGNGREWVSLSGRNVVDGFRRRGYATIGTGAVDWFDTSTPTGRLLTSDFDTFYFAGPAGIAAQVAFVEEQLARRAQPAFVFLNVGETHVPYHFAGAAWERRNPCVPFGEHNDAEACRVRQRACLEHVDRALGPLLERFAAASTLVCADHGDAWGEDGVWEHGLPHPKVLEVPLLLRLGTPPEGPA
ncbi:MAG TPA: hypothetical protein VHD91_07435 [Gaiellaceae bacterium]|nr:hypothetical protein [Gaiellaceae bacterium]